MLSDMQFIMVLKQILQSPGDTAPLSTFGETNLIINECFKRVFFFTSWQDINFIAFPVYFFSDYKCYMDLVRNRPGHNVFPSMFVLSVHISVLYITGSSHQLLDPVQ